MHKFRKYILEVITGYDVPDPTAFSEVFLEWGIENLCEELIRWIRENNKYMVTKVFKILHDQATYIE